MSAEGVWSVVEVAGHPCELFEPPYLSDTPRPTIGAVPARLAYGQTFALDASADAARVSLVGLSSTTHSFNSHQRHAWLTAVRAGAQLTVTAPANGTIAPPGPYFLFALNPQGVPSLGQVVWIGGV